ncbi:TNF receptor-associated factor 6-like [Argonauta hians]
MSEIFDEFESSLGDLHRKFICPVCLTLMVKPIQTKCGHRFCRECIFGVIAGRPQAKCPVDNSLFWVHTELFMDLAFERELKSLTFNCLNQKNGCVWNGEQNDLKSHVTNCQFVYIKCELCDDDVLSKSLMQHKTIDCPRRKVVCELCKEEIPYDTKLKHQVLSCELFPIDCPQCGQKGIQRKDLVEHINQQSGTCPLTVISCEYNQFGCNYVDYRKNMFYHISHETESHNRLLLKSFQKLEKRLEYIEQRFGSNLNLSENLNNKVEKMYRAISMKDAVQNIFKEKYSGCLLWQIDLDSNASIFISPSFYTANPGYRIGALLDISSCDDSIPYTMLSLSLKEGMYDDTLVFPFSGACLVTIFDQITSNSQQNYTLFFKCTKLHRYGEGGPACSEFQVSHKIMKTRDLLSSNYVKNNTIFLQVKVLQADKSQVKINSLIK